MSEHQEGALSVYRVLDLSDEKGAFCTKMLADLFLQESMTSKANESQNAFDFIDQQAKEYHEKLMSAEQALKDFRSKHIDARPGTETDVAKRIDAPLDERLHRFLRAADDRLFVDVEARVEYERNSR